MQAINDTAVIVGSAVKSRLGGLLVAALFLTLTLLVGCGPVQSTASISDAEVEFERARVANAHELAPYEYYSAKYYLHKAKEEWGYSDFEAAYDYARKARRDARNARIKANEDPWEGRPAKDGEVKDAEETEQPESDTEAGPRGF